MRKIFHGVLHPHPSISRYTLAEPYLWGRISLAPVAIGLFPVPEIINVAVRGTNIAALVAKVSSDVLEGVEGTFRGCGVTLRCSLIGTFIGVILGLGGFVPL